MNSTLKLPGALAQLGTLSGAQWAELGARYAPQIVAGLAVVGIAWQAAQLTWLLVASGPTAMAPASPAPDAAVPQAAANNINPQSIADAHLFGIATGGSNLAADPNNLPTTQMSLVLAGTMALDDPEAGFAIIGENAATAKFYRVGTVINGGVRLHSVYADRVILDRNGALETLSLPRGMPSAAPAPTARNVVTTSNPVGENLRRIITSNPSALGELLRAQPVFSNGLQKGFRVYPGRDRQQFTRLGLQPGDLVTSINGSMLDDPNRSNEILNTLIASSTAQVTVERNGASQQLTLDMAQISLPDAGSDSSDSSAGNRAPLQSNGFNGTPGNRSLRNNRNTGAPDAQPADASAQ
ncbi:MAG: type II secretion system protein GspC [Steroidobacteraceae bacterium]